MEVIVTKRAFYNGSLVEPSDKSIEVPDDLKGSWFAKVGTEEAKAAGKVESKTPPTPQTLSEISKGTSGQSFVQVHGGKNAKAAGKVESEDGKA